MEFDHLLLALGSETIVALLEAATIETDESVRRRLLTFVAAGGGFAGVETIGELNDFVREAARHYPKLNEALIRVIVVHPEAFLLPELGAELGAYAQRELSERKVDVITGARVERYDGSVVELSNGTAIPAESALTWPAYRGRKPSTTLRRRPHAVARPLRRRDPGPLA